MLTRAWLSLCGPQRALARPPPARPHARPPRASSAGTRPQPGPGGFGCPGASPHASEERALPRASASARSTRLQTPGRLSPRLGGARLGPGWGPSCPCGVASPRPAPSSPGRTASPPPSGSHVRSAGASMRQAVARPSVLSGCVLRLGRRHVTRWPQPAHFPWDGRPCGKTPPGYAAATARLTPRACFDATAHRRQDTDAPRPAASQGLAPSACGAGALAATRGPAMCALRADPTRLPHTICSGTMRARFREGRRDLLPSQNGRGGERPPPPPLPFAGGEERRGRPGSRLGAAHLRTGGEEECTGTADTTPGCNYLVRGYSPSMHYFWRGDMTDFSSPLPFQRGARGCRAAAVPQPRGGRAVDLGRPDQGTHGCWAAEVPRPPRMARRRPRPARAGQSRAAAVPRPDPRGRHGCARPPFRQGWHPWPAPGSGHPCRQGPARRSPRSPSAPGRHL